MTVCDVDYQDEQSNFATVDPEHGKYFGRTFVINVGVNYGIVGSTPKHKVRDT
jgi:hypothetical protein